MAQGLPGIGAIIQHFQPERRSRLWGDLYFDERYGELYEEIEKGSCQLFEFDHPLGHVRHLFIKREIPVLLGIERYFDIVTSYEAAR